MPDAISTESVLDHLMTAPCTLAGQFVNGSNYTFFLSLQSSTGEMQAVYKPVRGEAPLWDFPEGSLSKREVAAYRLSEAIGWHLVPPTVFRKKGLPFGAGSVQQFIDHDPQHHYFNLTPEEKDMLRPLALFDWLINNADRKGSHIIWSKDRHIYGIDHGVCFHVEDKLRTVIWDFSGQVIPSNLLSDLEKILPKLYTGNELFDELRQFLRVREIKALAARASHILTGKTFPESDNTRRQFPWPPV